jgi:asparagine synthase (glutamine-hydrolysing)
MRADKMAMATSVEAREPYLDHHLVEFMMHVPAELRFKNGTTKYLLKKVCEGILPHSVIYRKKVGFAAPTARWFKNGRFFPAYFKKVYNQALQRVDLPIIPKALTWQNMHSHQPGFAVQKWVLQNIWALQ